MSSTLAVFLMTLTAVMTLPVFNPATPKVSILSIDTLGVIESANELVTEAAKQTVKFQPAANLKAGFMLLNYEKEFSKDTVSSYHIGCGLAWPAHSSREPTYDVVHIHAPHLMRCTIPCRPPSAPSRTARESVSSSSRPGR